LDGSFSITNLNTYYALYWPFGGRSNLDIKLKHNFIKKQSHWLGVKAHYKLDFQKIMLGCIILRRMCGVSKEIFENKHANSS
jgi:hypothetical protein